MDKQRHVVSSELPSLHPLDIFWQWLEVKIYQTLFIILVFLFGMLVGWLL